MERYRIELRNDRDVGKNLIIPMTRLIYLPQLILSFVL